MTKKEDRYHGATLTFSILGKPKPTTSEYVEVRDSPIHGKGVFAAKDIPKGARVIEYVGVKVSKDEAEGIADEQYQKGESIDHEDGHVYLFELDDDWDIDGNYSWNTARLINHSCDPNCETEDNDSEIWIIALRDIKSGEELSYNYGYDIDNWEDHPCRCGTEKCVGHIVAEKEWPKLEKLKAKKRAKKKSTA